MQISVLEKLLQLISPKNSPKEERSLEEILEQETERDEGMQNLEQDVEMQNLEQEMQDLELECEEEPIPEEPSDKAKPTRLESNRSHLTSSVPRVARPPKGDLTKGELAEIRALFSNLDDKEIQRLYKKVTK